MKTRILICIATILILSTCAVAFLNISTQDNSADLIINTSQNKILLKAVDLESIAFDATLIIYITANGESLLYSMLPLKPAAIPEQAADSIQRIKRRD